jgi:hypothetical protein
MQSSLQRTRQEVWHLGMDGSPVMQQTEPRSCRFGVTVSSCRTEQRWVGVPNFWFADNLFATRQ